MFFESDVATLLSWCVEAQDAATIRCPVFFFGGSDSGPWFAAARAHVLRLLPQVEGAVVHGGGHAVASTHTSDMAEMLVDVLGRNPLR